MLPTPGRAAGRSEFELNLSGQAKGASSPRHHQGGAEKVSGIPSEFPQIILLTSSTPSLLNSCHFSPKTPWSWTFHEPGASGARASCRGWGSFFKKRILAIKEKVQLLFHVVIQKMATCSLHYSQQINPGFNRNI